MFGVCGTKQNMFKKHGRVCYNYKNLPKTMIRLCQISHCCMWGMDEDPRPKLITTNRALTLVSLASSKSELIKMGLAHCDKVFRCKCMELYGITYRIGLSVVLESSLNSESHLPTFGKIQEIIILENEEVYLLCKLWNTQYIHERLNAYCVQQSQQYVFTKIDKLIHEKPISEWKDYGENQSFFVLRHMLL